MINALIDFASHKEEVNKYFDFLVLIHKRGAKVSYTYRRNNIETSIDSDTKIIMRANAFLMLYNLVEATVQDCIEAIYASILADSLTYINVREEIQKIWLRCAYRKLEKQEATHDTYIGIAKKLVDDVAHDTIVDIHPDFKVGFSGNLDAERIRQVAKIYGFTCKVSKRAKGGSSLETVKNNRNALAHGNLSFVECGRVHAVQDLVKIKRETIHFLEGVLLNVKKYIDSKEYVSPQSTGSTSS